jgi:hypothetical protein
MQLQWHLLGIAFSVNTAWIVIMWLAQALDTSLPPRHSIIPGTTQKFLYMQDLWTLWGDLIGVPLIATAFAHVVENQHMSLYYWVACGLICVLSIVIFLGICLASNHKPDMGFPDIGTISWNGRLHLPYFGLGIAVAAICLWQWVITGNLRGTPMWLGIIGGIVYLTFFIIEVRSGNFDPLDPIIESPSFMFNSSGDSKTEPKVRQ